jgi:formaldehyde-activating enzyme involved in methanogenesis
MLKFLGLLIVLTTTFATGFYLGRHSIGELTKTVADTVTDLSRNVVDTTVGLERSLRGRQSLVEVKAQVVQAKSDILDHNFGSATKALNQAVSDLERTKQIEKVAERTTQINNLILKIRATRQEIASGRTIARARLDDIQKEVDKLAVQ